MLAKKDVLALSDLTPPVVTVYLNTMRRDPNRHLRVAPEFAGFRKKPQSMARRLPSWDSKDFLRDIQRVDFLQARHSEEKALAIFAGQKAWKLVVLTSHVENENSVGQTCHGKI